jgi:hypothetical protein
MPRRRLLDRLRDGEATVPQLADELGASQQDEKPPGRTDNVFD